MKSSAALNYPLSVLITSTLLFSAELYAQSAEAGRKLAQKGDFKGAVQVLQPLAAQGDSEAAFILGRMYARGDGVGQDFKRAFALFEQAAYAGHLDAAERLAMMYDRGDGVSRSKKMAQLWRRVAVGAEPPPPRPTAAPPVAEPTLFAVPTEIPTVLPTSLPEEEAPPTETVSDLPSLEGDSFGIAEPSEPVPTTTPTAEPTVDRHLRELRSLPRPMRPREFDSDPAVDNAPVVENSSGGSDEDAQQPSWKSLFW